MEQTWVPVQQGLPATLSSIAGGESAGKYRGGSLGMVFVRNADRADVDPQRAKQRGL
jgi:hypothetical protein